MELVLIVGQFGIKGFREYRYDVVISPEIVGLGNGKMDGFGLAGVIIRLVLMKVGVGLEREFGSGFRWDGFGLDVEQLLVGFLCVYFGMGQGLSLADSMGIGEMFDWFGGEKDWISWFAERMDRLSEFGEDGVGIWRGCDTDGEDGGDN